MKPNFAIIHEYVNKALTRDSFNKAVEVDTSKAIYQGVTWNNLSEFYKRKFENLIVLMHMKEGLVKVIYR